MKTKHLHFLIYFFFIVIFSSTCSKSLYKNHEPIPRSVLWKINVFQGKQKIFHNFYSVKKLECKLDSLPPQEYTFEFISIFNDTIVKDIFVKSNFKLPKAVNNYYNYNFTDINKSILNNLSLQDTLYLLFESSGCFHFEKTLFKIFNKNENLEIVQYKEGQLIPIEIKNLKTRLKKLIQKGKKYNGQFGCTTIDFYFFKRDNNIFTIADGSCDWNGIDILLKDK